MSDAFTGEIRIFGGNFPPRSWAFCDGQLQAISQNDALFSLFGTTYGGDGRTTFGLPDLRGRIPIHVGQGPGLTNRRWGEKSGQENVAIDLNHLATHDHAISASKDPVSETRPGGNVTAANATPKIYRNAAAPPIGNAVMATNMVGTAGTGGGAPTHPNMMPFLVVSFIVCLYGIYPSRH